MQKIFLAAAVVLLAGSCSKSTLNLQNPNQITTGTFWKTENDVLSAMAATYNSLRSTNNSGIWSVRGTELTNGRGDDFFIRNDVADLYKLSTFTNAPDNGVVDALWNCCYQGIFSANQIIAYTPGISSIDPTTQGQLIGEARFLRGVFYFFLASNFGDVPLHLTVPVTQSDYYVAKSPQADVWKQIDSDFIAAAAVLPTSYPSQWVGRATQGAAIAYLGKSYIYQNDWADAEATLTKIMSGQYSLMPVFADNFDVAHGNNAESVFEIQVADVGGTNPWTSGANESLGLTTAQEFAPAQVSGWFELYPTDKLYNEFQKEKTTAGNFDPRMVETLVWQSESATGGGVTQFYQLPISTFFPTEFGFSSRIKKYQNYGQSNEVTGSNGGNYTSSIDERAYRYADVLLFHAEAVTMQGRPQNAYTDLNAIRERASLADLPAGYTQAQMMAEIQHQRMIEFAREGYRFYDLRRWGLLQTAMANTDKPGAQFYVPGKFDYFPIPQAELDANPKMVQNPAWQ
ncbi:RagB/SusD family nutrient uptake outer membrane protein [Dinghuibacter silviterrae]|uniref:Putative outer membrane starch-binding protein n=1 Tax=Dinghuibacter silviterrae TaxID=1539049 RepID=A0A4R8DRN8_9BACT|nr:RagB/SusD family nutrient uptake outer membrane protein [Dinghuibacter silviterrae]TDX00880.1 putative outer membrane starch-binding protein [Dinghuibacter silviterrae]